MLTIHLVKKGKEIVYPDTNVQHHLTSINSVRAAWLCLAKSLSLDGDRWLRSVMIDVELS